MYTEYIIKLATYMLYYERVCYSLIPKSAQLSVTCSFISISCSWKPGNEANIFTSNYLETRPVRTSGITTNIYVWCCLATKILWTWTHEWVARGDNGVWQLVARGNMQQICLQKKQHLPSLVPRLSPRPFLFFVGARGEPGNEASIHQLMLLHQSGDSF